MQQEPLFCFIPLSAKIISGKNNRFFEIKEMNEFPIPGRI